MDGIVEADCCQFCKHKDSIMYDKHRCILKGVPVELTKYCPLFERKEVYKKILSDKINTHTEEI